MRNIQSKHMFMMGSVAALAMLSMSDSFICRSEDEGTLSLADLADLDVSDVEELRFENLPAGVYDFEVLDAKLEEGTNKDGDKRFTAIFEFKVLECKAVIKPGVDRESLKDKKHTEKFYLEPSKPAEDTAKTIGRIRAFVTDMGCESAGKLGAIVGDTKGHIFSGKIKDQPDKDDKSIVYARMSLDAKKK